MTQKARQTHPIERCNNSLRQRVSRLGRETLAFSKTLAPHRGAIKHCIGHYHLETVAALPVEHYQLTRTIGL
jgi:IS1 transposase